MARLRQGPKNYLSPLIAELGDEGSGKRQAALVLDEDGKAVTELDNKSRNHGSGEFDLDKLNALTLGTLLAARLC